MHPIWLFDYDLTLYGAEESHVLGSLDRNITRFLEVRFGISQEEADIRRKDYCARFGTTLGGLRAIHGVLPEEYFDYIHVGENLKMPMADAKKRALLLSLPGERWVFTNARRDWAERGLESMGISDCFQGIMDIETFQWESKPNPIVYEQVEKKLGNADTRFILLEDKAENLVPAYARGWKTIWVNPNDKDVSVKCDLHLCHLMDLSSSQVEALLR